MANNEITKRTVIGWIYFHLGVIVSTWLVTWKMGFLAPENLPGNLFFSACVGVILAFVALDRYESLRSIIDRLASRRAAGVMLVVLGATTVLLALAAAWASLRGISTLAPLLFGANPLTAFIVGLGACFVIAWSIARLFVWSVNRWLQSRPALEEGNFQL